jgi:hypothetical protein
MSKEKFQKPTAKSNTPVELFNKGNYIWMLVGLALLAIGFFLMNGGKSADPKVFDPNGIYSFERITLAPIFIVAGFLVEIYAIMKKDKSEEDTTV